MGVRLSSWIAIATLVAMTSVLRSADAAVMTFDPLPPGFQAVPVYSEAGITIDATIPGFHFHAVADGSGGTAAQMFQSDAFPQVVTMSAGAFSLLSIDFLSFAGTIDAVLTSSSGAMEIINTTGTFNFGSGFWNITSVTISSQEGGADLNFVLDNITTNVPEPMSLALLGLGLAGLGFSRRKRVN